MRVTGSSLPLLARCQWWARPDVDAPARPATSDMQLGSAVHAAIESILRDEAAQLEPELDQLSEEAAPFVDVWREWWASSPLGAGQWRAEVAFAYDPATDTARELGEVRGRAYPATKPSEIAGTVDAVLLDGARDLAIVVDWKTGGDWDRLTADAADNRQLRGYALAASRAYGVETVRVVVARISEEEVSTTSRDYDALELAAAADELRRQLAAVPTAHPAPGLWCKRCRAVAVCPATVEAVDALAPAGDPPAPVPLVVTRENAGALLGRLRAVEAACGAVEAALRAFADANGGIETTDGRRWRKTSTERSSIRLDGPEAAIALSVLDAHEVGAAVERKVSTSRAAIERAVKARGLKGKAATAHVEAIVDELRAAGAVRTSVVEAYREGSS